MKPEASASGAPNGRAQGGGRLRRLCCAVALATPLLAVAVMHQWPNRLRCGETCWGVDALHLEPGEAAAQYCNLASTSKVDTKEFQKKGFLVLKDWLSKDAVDELLTIHARVGDLGAMAPGKNGGSVPGYRIPSTVGIDVFQEVPELRRKIHDIVEAIDRETDISIAPHGEFYSREAVMFHTNASQENSMMFGWHQDVENYFLFNDLYNYLDFYAMLEKPRKDEAGIMVVPFDLLKDRSPRLHDLTYKAQFEHSASSFWPASEHATAMMQSGNDMPWMLNFTLDSVSCSPELEPGDLILFRGDVIHRTQPHNSWRTSININVHPSLGKLRVEDLLAGGLWKYNWVSMAKDQYLSLHGYPPFVDARIDLGLLYRRYLHWVKKTVEMATEGGFAMF